MEIAGKISNVYCLDMLTDIAFFRCRQNPSGPEIPESEIAGRVHDEFHGISSQLKPGMRIGVAVGSRGIAGLSSIVKAVIVQLHSIGCQPFIFPAMGSHGGATAAGQTEVLKSYGITEVHCGCPIQSSMEVVTLSDTGLPFPVYMDRFAWESDGVILINRVKPHTDFRGEFESGLMKMAVIGLGKEAQATEIHRYGVHGLKDLMPQAAHVVLASGKIIAGLGIVENALDTTAEIRVAAARAIPDMERELLALARTLFPKLPTDRLDLLVLDRIGKDISGTGMDTNVVGRIRIPGEPEPESPNIRHIHISDLSDASHGNATGLGLADTITRKLFDKMDHNVTRTNIFTSGFLERGKIPFIADDDRHALNVSLRTMNIHNPSKLRAIRVRDTLHLYDFLATRPVLDELGIRPDSMEPILISECFDDSGHFNPVFG